MANHTPLCLARVPFEVATHVRVPSRVLGRAKPVGYTDLCYTTKSHACVLGLCGAY
ncbi:Major DNA-binding [Gossypium arboreum]|uniref:Major DNA-binding n=1 Tax=Gossypium arboreum TaxID=29729 RepID=A0A0B0PNI4_GOSAR|nr:Major DNA-binding [Gossypium arboreum]